MLLLTVPRTKNLREWTWDEFDFKAAMWRISAERMKAAVGTWFRYRDRRSRCSPTAAHTGADVPVPEWARR